MGYQGNHVRIGASPAILALRHSPGPSIPKKVGSEETAK